MHPTHLLLQPLALAIPLPTPQSFNPAQITGLLSSIFGSIGPIISSAGGIAKSAGVGNGGTGNGASANTQTGGGGQRGAGLAGGLGGLVPGMG